MIKMGIGGVVPAGNASNRPCRASMHSQIWDIDPYQVIDSPMMLQSQTFRTVHASKYPINDADFPNTTPGAS
jgi:hypothetical protein